MVERLCFIKRGRSVVGQCNITRSITTLEATTVLKCGLVETVSQRRLIHSTTGRWHRSIGVITPLLYSIIDFYELKNINYRLYAFLETTVP